MTKWSFCLAGALVCALGTPGRAQVEPGAVRARKPNQCLTDEELKVNKTLRALNRPTTKSDPQAMNSSWPKSRPTRYGRRKMARVEAPVNIESSPRISKGRPSGLSALTLGLGSTAVCSAIAGVLLRDRPLREVSCYRSRG